MNEKTTNGAERRLGSTNETNFRVEKLLPAQHYRFCVLAINFTGASPPSNYLEYLSAPGVPDSVGNLFAKAISTEKIQLNWTKPKSNGSPILNIRIFVYKIKSNDNFEIISEIILKCDETSFLIENLKIETNYE